ncbi:phenylalanine--tRNA ligase subunit beta [Calderihabitans maritimus]|uniref:Phenylalanine--tRNA ligase beta subunit n=1 Tax=Calderihabitans maritimus TaxID=1246530 RepID=A0A1Z5HSG0_9FIRM|nr:phenylalanine--tRNA ligase subunit beta [Calderihabitans maritimus]GAW92271.1 phenylalanyl-tRNA synthetase subunit beta [Calderihabitans maritimus]
MRVPYNWLKEYVEVDLSPHDLADRMTMAGIAVDTVHYLAEGLERVIVGEIVDIQNHPNADKLVVCRVDVGQEAPLQIVTGAPNVAVGQRVPVALPGAQLPSGLKISTTSLRGVESQGMLCSAEELELDWQGLPGHEEGILILDGRAPVGESVAKVLGLDDYVLELDLTPNRADCLSIVNVAREVAAITGARLKLPEIVVEEIKGDISSMASVEIEDKNLCGRYIARIFTDIRIEPSPLWMQQRLHSAGVRPINNIVDITNYVMLELGQPLHAFDYDTLEGRRIIVRRARKGEKIVTLDQVERNLDPEMLVIADALHPVALAGVMGGLETEVTERTQNILLEAAHFNPTSIRRTSRKLGLRSEASMRFEKGVNIDGTLLAANRAAQLVNQLGAGKVVRGVIDCYETPAVPVSINLRVSRVNKVLGTELDREAVANILARLHFQVVPVNDDILKVDIPTYRLDVTREIDLVEEVARIYGYDQIPLTLPQGATAETKKNKLQKTEEKIRQVLADCGLMEVITYSFTSPKVFDRIRLPEEDPLRKVVRLRNPLSEEQSVMRTTLLPGLLETAQRNVSRNNRNMAIYEVGHVFIPKEEGKLPEERLKAAALVMGQRPRGWNWPAQELDFFYLKGVLEELLEQLGISAWNLVRTTHPALHPGRTAEIRFNGETAGFMGEVHPDVQENYELPRRTCVFELDLVLLDRYSTDKKKYVPLPKFPAVERDLAVVVPEEVPVKEVEERIVQSGGDLLKAVRLFDVYRGEQIKPGYKSLAYSLLYQSPDRTLKDEEVNELHHKIIEALVDAVGAQLRVD